MASMTVRVNVSSSDDAGVCANFWSGGYDGESLSLVLAGGNRSESEDVDEEEMLEEGDILSSRFFSVQSLILICLDTDAVRQERSAISFVDADTIHQKEEGE